MGLLAGAAGVAVLLRLVVARTVERLAMRLIVLFAGAGVVVVCAASLLVYSLSRRNYEKEVREKYTMLAQMLAAGVGYETVAAVRTVEDEQYQELLARFKMAVKKSSNIDWIGIYLTEGEHLYYGIDTDESGLYTPVFKVSPRHREVLQSGRSGYFEYEDETGRYLAAVAPVTDSTGAARTILEVSCDLRFPDAIPKGGPVQCAVGVGPLRHHFLLHKRPGVADHHTAGQGADPGGAGG